MRYYLFVDIKIGDELNRFWCTKRGTSVNHWEQMHPELRAHGFTTMASAERAKKQAEKGGEGPVYISPDAPIPSFYTKIGTHSSSRNQVLTDPNYTKDPKIIVGSRVLFCEDDQCRWESGIVRDIVPISDKENRLHIDRF